MSTWVWVYIALLTAITMAGTGLLVYLWRAFVRLNRQAEASRQQFVQKMDELLDIAPNEAHRKLVIALRDAMRKNVVKKNEE